MKKIMFVLVLFVLLPSVFGIKIVREAPTLINYGEILTVTVKVYNDGDMMKAVKITERLPANAELIDPVEADRMFSRTVRVLEEDLEISPKGVGVFEYKIKPVSRLYQSPPTKVFDKSDGEVFYSTPLKVEIEGVPKGNVTGVIVFGGVVALGVGLYLFRKFFK